jgi:hypothetical protein
MCTADQFSFNNINAFISELTTIFSMYISGITAVAKIGIKAFPQVSAFLFGKQAT